MVTRKNISTMYYYPAKCLCKQLLVFTILMVHVVVAFIATVIDQQHICFVILLDNVHGMSYFVKARVSIAHYRPDIGGGGGHYCYTCSNVDKRWE